MTTPRQVSIDATDIARQLGFDNYCYAQSARLDWHPAVLEGYREAFVGRATHRRPDRFERKWLQLRMNALRRGRVVDSLISPQYLRQIDVEECPVLRCTLTHGAGTGTDWSIDRLNNDGAYAPYNLAVMSTSANHAKGNRDFDEIILLATGKDEINALTSQQWMRVACLMLGACFVEDAGHAPILPLVTPLPLFTARGIAQQIQYVLTIHARRAAGKNALIRSFREVSRAPAFLDPLVELVECVHLGLKHVDRCWDVWLTDGVTEALVKWRRDMGDQLWGKTGHIAISILGAGKISESDLLSWRLASGGYFADVHQQAIRGINSVGLR